ncbi:MAG: cob(I)yrinic acid a,c-diamide adenosyltransferase [Oscillospiraceae bacterium]
MLQIYMGNGKGKTTASIGLAVRFAGTGENVLISQFMKGSKTSELNSLKYIPNVEVIRNPQDFGFYKSMTDFEKYKMTCMHNNTLDYIETSLKLENFKLVVLDEVTHAYNYNLLDKRKIERIINTYSNTVEIVVTGRNPSEFFLNRADYITNMESILHPFDKGVKARKGIEF